MFGKYIATEADLEAIERGIFYTWCKKLTFIFKKRKFLENVNVVSYDSKFIYLWTKQKVKNAKKINIKLAGNFYFTCIPHRLKMKDKLMLGWRAALLPKELKKFLPQNLQKNYFKNLFISGGLLTPFIVLQKLKKRPLNPYITYESYLATIIHEFAHAYWQNHKLWWYSDLKENINLLRVALHLYLNKKVDFSKSKIKIPNYHRRDALLSEIFAYCTEYAVAKIFWSNHQKNLDRYNQRRIKKLIKEEKQKDLLKQNSVLETDFHDGAAVISKLIVEKFRSKWPGVLIKNVTI